MELGVSEAPSRGEECSDKGGQRMTRKLLNIDVKSTRPDADRPAWRETAPDSGFVTSERTRRKADGVTADRSYRHFMQPCALIPARIVPCSYLFGRPFKRTDATARSAATRRVNKHHVTCDHSAVTTSKCTEDQSEGCALGRNRA